MFGEKDIIGMEYVKLTNNNKLKLPDFTYAYSKDKLILTRLGENLAIFNYDSYLSIIYELEDKYFDEKDLNEKKRLEKLIKKFYYSIIRDIICDKYCMITIPKNISFKDKIYSNEILCVGERNHLILKPIKKN